MAGQLAEVILEQLDDGYDLNDAAADAHYGTKMLADAIAHDEMFKFDMRAAGIDPESDGWYAEVHQVKTVLRMLMAEWPRVVRVAEILIQQAATKPRDGSRGGLRVMAEFLCLSSLMPYPTWQCHNSMETALQRAVFSWVILYFLPGVVDC